jgi:hypothetical protein
MHLSADSSFRGRCVPEESLLSVLSEERFLASLGMTMHGHGSQNVGAPTFSEWNGVAA